MIKSPVVIITGAAGGIGRATALKFAGNGYALALVDINGSGLKDLEKKLKEMDCNFLSLTGDLRDLHFISAIVDKTVAKWGRIDVLVNNAAWRTIETMRTITEENWEKTLKINLTAPAFLAKHTAALMEKNNTPGVIINISSVMSQRTSGHSPAYVACKGGIESLTYELAVLYGPKGIRVVTVNPGNVQTDLSGDFKDEKGENISEAVNKAMSDNTPLQRSGTPEEIVNVIFWLSSKEASFITGTSIYIDGGFFHNFNDYKTKKLQFPKEL